MLNIPAPLGMNPLQCLLFVFPLKHFHIFTKVPSGSSEGAERIDRPSSVETVCYDPQQQLWNTLNMQIKTEVCDPSADEDKPVERDLELSLEHESLESLKCFNLK